MCDRSSMAERNLAMVEVAGSIPVGRSFFLFFILLNYYPLANSKNSFFSSTKNKIFRYIKKKSYTNIVAYGIHSSFKNKSRLLAHYNYISLPKFLMEDLNSAKEISSNGSE